MTGTYPNFGLTLADGVARIVIDRARKRNSLPVAMWKSLVEICAELAAEKELRAVVLTGAGPSFCAGADISALSEDDDTVKAAVGRAEQAVRNLAVPTIARISGHCIGGGSQLAIACDLRVADTTAVFAVPPAKLGVIYAVSSTRALVDLVGPAAAKRLLFTAQTIDATTALRIGLVDEVVAAPELDAAVDRLLGELLPLAPMTQLAAKELVNAIVDGAIVDGAIADGAIAGGAAGAGPAAETVGTPDEIYARWMADWRRSPDGVEGPRAFLERRSPQFSWRRVTR